MRVDVEVHVAASSGVSRVELVSVGRLNAADRGDGKSREGHADGLGDGGHDGGGCYRRRVLLRCDLVYDDANEARSTRMTCQKYRVKRG